ncbi:COG1361 S-layer family protein [Halobacteriaceae archaeon GCM10025711]
MVRTAGTPRPLAVVLAAVVALSLVPGPADAVVRGEPDIDAFVVNDAVAPGEDATLLFTLVNRGDLTVGSAVDRTLADQVTTARAVEVTLDEGRAPLTVRSPTRAIGRLPVGAEPTVGFNVSVAPDADPGTYVVHLRLEYTHTSVVAEETGSQQDRTVHDTVDVEIRVADRARFEARAAATNVSVGDTGRLALSLRNVGSATARDASVTLSSPDADLAFGAGEPSSTSFVGTWRPGETRRVESRVTLPGAALVRDYRVTAVVAYTDEDGVERRSDPVEVGVVPGPSRRSRSRTSPARSGSPRKGRCPAASATTGPGRSGTRS